MLTYIYLCKLLYSCTNIYNWLELSKGIYTKCKTCWYFIYFYIRLNPYKEYHDDIIQFVGSIQLCLTLLTGLILNLQQGTHSEMGEEEKRNLGILLVVMNLGIIFVPKIREFLCKL